MENKKTLDTVTQFALPILTICGQIAISMKFPEWGLILNLIVQPFWLYSTWKAYKKAGQIGVFISTVILTILILAGVINYWFL